MPPPSTLYRFQIELSDIDRGLYESLDFRAAQHPSESEQYLMTRVLALALNAGPNMNFSPGGLSEPDEPCLRQTDQNGTVEIWIEVGSPSARKLHKASKIARKVKVYTYKDPALLLNEIKSGDIHRVNELEIYSFNPKFLDALALRLERNNSWSLLHNEGVITIGIGEESEQGELARHAIR